MPGAGLPGTGSSGAGLPGGSASGASGLPGGGSGSSGGIAPGVIGQQDGPGTNVPVSSSTGTAGSSQGGGGAGGSDPRVSPGTGGHGGSGGGSTYEPGPGNTVTASPEEIRQQASQWADWSARMTEINGQLSATAAGAGEFGMIKMPAGAYAASQTASDQWSQQASQQFAEFATALAGTALDFAATEANGASQANAIHR